MQIENEIQSRLFDYVAMMESRGAHPVKLTISMSLYLCGDLVRSKAARTIVSNEITRMIHRKVFNEAKPPTFTTPRYVEINKEGR